MAWTAKIARWYEDEAEIRVTVIYVDAAGDGQGSEQIVMPTGTPEARILEEAGRRGRSLRAAQGRVHVEDNPNVGKVFPLDDL